MATKVKRDFVLMVELWGTPDPQEIVDAISALRAEAQKEFGLEYVERADVIGPNRGSGPDAVPVLILRAYPHKDAGQQV